ncbi:hypothetical protein AZE42_04627 [Rhizopogon vesiculosus]|uniref:Uncharacterized protein n=1 Tax=Rhizopogon vesiculosus TaxID=180088 RepID=A0A1J8R3I5_9AGAM|nr:hypothetical protein AZE42_04627 [Rhizopogon vesiculosus]
MYSRQANELVINLLNTTGAVDPSKHIQAYPASLITAITYGPIVHGGEDSFVARARELIDIATRISSPGRAAMYTAFPFREFYNPMGCVNLNTQCWLQSKSC